MEVTADDIDKGIDVPLIKECVLQVARRSGARDFAPLSTIRTDRPFSTSDLAKLQQRGPFR